MLCYYIIMFHPLNRSVTNIKGIYQLSVLILKLIQVERGKISMLLYDYNNKKIYLVINTYDFD